MHTIIDSAREKSIPVVFALTRKKLGTLHAAHGRETRVTPVHLSLGMALGRRTRVSAVALLSSEGLSMFPKALKLAEELRLQWLARDLSLQYDSNRSTEEQCEPADAPSATTTQEVALSPQPKAEQSHSEAPSEQPLADHKRKPMKKQLRADAAEFNPSEPLSFVAPPVSRSLSTTTSGKSLLSVSAPAFVPSEKW